MNYKIWHQQKSVILTKKIGKETIIHAPVWIGQDVVIGQRVKIQAFAFIPEGVRLEDDVFIGPGVVMTNDKYPPSQNWTETLVKKGAVIGAGATILPGITIGIKSVIGAGSVVTKDIPDGETWVGNPASKKKMNKEKIKKQVIDILLEDVSDTRKEGKVERIKARLKKLDKISKEV